MNEGTEHVQEVEPREDIQPGIRPDLRLPSVSFGRCVITGEWGKVVNLDPGDMVIKCPVLDNDKIDYDPVTGQVNFREYEDKYIQTNISVSEEGLRQLLAFAESEENPIPTLSHNSTYMWSVMYTDSGGLRQFGYDDNQQEIEFQYSDIDLARVAQFSVVPRLDPTLPSFTFVKDSGKFYKNGVEVDTEYDGEYDPTANLFYARKVTHTTASALSVDGLTREIKSVHTSVLQLIGWHQGPRDTVENQTSTERGFVLAIDERGSSRGWWEHS